MCTHPARAIIRCHVDSCPPSLTEVKQCIFRWYLLCPSAVRIVVVFYQVNTNVWFRVVFLGMFSEIVLISLNLDGFSNIGIILKYEPIRMLRRGTTYHINQTYDISWNEQKFSNWIWKVRQSTLNHPTYMLKSEKFLIWSINIKESARTGQSNSSNGKESLDLIK